MTIDYTIPDSLVIRDATAAADSLRNYREPAVTHLVSTTDRLVEALREMTQAHAESIEQYQALRRRVRDAIASEV